MACDDQNRRMVVMGAGVSGLAAARFLLARGAQVTVVDRRPLDQLPEAARSLCAQGAVIECGDGSDATLLAADEIVLSPGVPPTLPGLERARQAGVSIIGEIELAFRHLRGRIVAITGSNGKSTTTTLVGQLLAEGGLPTQVGGNIGVAAVSLVETSREDGWTVLECSSFQLETVVTFRPQVGVLLNITPDHLDRHGTFERYVAAKLNLFRCFDRETLAVLNADDPTTPRAQALLAARGAPVTLFSAQRELAEGLFLRGNQVICRTREAERILLDRADIPLPGQHNLENALASLAVALAAGVAPEDARTTICRFRGLEHRMEFVAEINGVRYFNDSKATNIAAAQVAIASFPAGLHVILGGLDKGSDFAPLVEVLAPRAASVALIGKAAEKLEATLAGRLPQPVTRHPSLADAVAALAARARPGDTVLLAPACASFDMFDNFEHRGQVFKNIVKGEIANARSKPS
ncbi:UDP-N-acetylmuramoyl-L-alanine--D-glutamate ligase [Chloracidobacterium validum]|uniref:UDP-N-acetylmuramoylalanine--D-glutamate ligase n=1 Tax=Chloracidobacterium validum TaxID=2821543 RepID=A0ABX8BDB7_9BACT|nr:UDP-N-acetylmuramoyl-L-alanine--D-glutamate ligase [Chloracidobacterium validum]QUW03530.1 UDP-N-acetylmuramoyl-L-alanine--D-glutamate ligase [Chloracidobacterium validum]